MVFEENRRKLFAERFFHGVGQSVARKSVGKRKLNVVFAGFRVPVAVNCGRIRNVDDHFSFLNVGLCNGSIFGFKHAVRAVVGHREHDVHREVLSHSRLTEEEVRVRQNGHNAAVPAVEKTACEHEILGKRGKVGAVVVFVGNSYFGACAKRDNRSILYNERTDDFFKVDFVVSVSDRINENVVSSRRCGNFRAFGTEFEAQAAHHAVREHFAQRRLDDEAVVFKRSVILSVRLRYGPDGLDDD